MNAMRHTRSGTAARPDRWSAGAVGGRWMFVLVAGSISAASPAQWQSALQACAGGALSPQQRVGACSEALKAEQLSPRQKAVALDNRGVAWKEQGDVEQALEDYNRALAADPSLAAAYSNRGAALGSKGNLDAAMSDFDQAIQLDPKLALAYENRGALLRSRGELDGAIKDLNQAILLGRQNERCFTERAAAWQAKGDLGKAVADLGEAIHLDPTRAELFIARGLLLDHLRDYTRSIADYDEAIRLNPSSAVAFNNRCNTWLIKEAYDQATADCTQALKLDPKLAQAHFNRGVLWTLSADYAKAKDEFDQAISLDPKLAPAYKSRGTMSFYSGQFEAAQGDLSQAARLWRSDPYVPIWLYLSEARAGHPEDAARDLAQNTSDVGEAWPSAVIQLYLGRTDPAGVNQAAQQGDARSQNGRQCEAAFYIGEWYLLRGEKGQALRRLEDAARSCPVTFSESGGARAELDRISR